MEYAEKYYSGKTLFSISIPSLDTKVTFTNAKEVDRRNHILAEGKAKYYWVNVNDRVDFVFSNSGTLKRIEDYHHGSCFHTDPYLKWAIEGEYRNYYQKAVRSLKIFKKLEKES